MNYALLVARQRSGTGALGSVLDKHPELKYVGEVFHPSNVGKDNNFFTFFLKAVAENPEAALPDAMYGIFEAFVAQLSEKHGGRTPVVDVKYRSLHHLDGGWRGLVQRPLILQEAINRKAPIIHLTRLNTVQSFVSGRLAEENQVWHARKDQDINVQSTVINVRQLSNYLVNSQREIELIEEWTKKYPHLCQFDYAELMDDDGNLARDIADRLATTLGIGPFKTREPSFRKQAPAELSKSIENFDVVRNALAGTPYLWMLK